MLQNPEVKLNWQATPKDMFSFVYFNGSKVKDYRSPAVAGILTDAPTATFHQDNAYTDFPLQGLWKIADDRVVSPNLFLSAKYAYYNTGNALTPMGGMDMQAGRSLTTAQSYGSINQAISERPQQTVRASAHSFVRTSGLSHDLEFGSGYRTTDSTMFTEWPGNGILGMENSPTDFRAQVFRQGNGVNRANYFDAFVGDTISKGRATINVGLRFDRQWGRALESTIEGNKAFPDLVPGPDVRRLRLAVCLEHVFTARRPRVRARRAQPDGRTGVLQPVCQPAQPDHDRRYQPRHGGRLGDVSLGGHQPRPLRAGERGADEPAPHAGRRVQPGKPDSGHLGEPDRSEPQGARGPTASSSASTAS